MSLINYFEKYFRGYNPNEIKRNKWLKGVACFFLTGKLLCASQNNPERKESTAGQCEV